MNDRAVAQAILNQLGGGLFIAMTGARGLLSTEKSLSFMLPFGPFNGQRINKVSIVLTPDDLYDVHFLRVTRKGVETVTTSTGIFNNQLRDEFTRVTGLRTKL